MSKRNPSIHAVLRTLQKKSSCLAFFLATMQPCDYKRVCQADGCQTLTGSKQPQPKGQKTMTMNKENALKVTKKAISAYLEDEEGLLDDYRYYVFVKKDIYDSVDMLNMTLSQRKSFVSKADLITLDTACDAMYWIGKHATQAQLTDAFGSTKDTNAISLEEYLKKNH